MFLMSLTLTEKVFTIILGKYIFIVFPYCDGGDLGHQLLKRQRIPEKEAIEILHQMVKGLKNLYEHNVLHRDLKPDNIFIKDKNKYLIADFGFARIFKEPNGPLDSMVGTPLYESP